MRRGYRLLSCLIKNTADAYRLSKEQNRIMFPDSTPHICDSRTDLIPSAQISRDAALPHFGASPFRGPCPARHLVPLLMTQRILYLNGKILNHSHGYVNI